VTVEEALEELTEANFHSEHEILARRITELEDRLAEAYQMAGVISAGGTEYTMVDLLDLFSKD